MNYKSLNWSAKSVNISGNLSFFPILTLHFSSGNMNYETSSRFNLVVEKLMSFPRLTI